MNDKHTPTPGPWCMDFGATRFDIFCSENGYRVASVAKPSVQARGKEYREDYAYCEANARLIAAAPDLYDACDNALNVLLACCVPAGGVDDRKAILDAQAMLRAAISRATSGEQT